MILLQMFWEFFKTGLFAVGGGLATVPFLYDIAARYDWLDASIIPDMIAVSEATPGPIGINMATFTGYNAAGILGAVVATLGLVAPALIVGIIVFRILDKFMANRYVDGAFRLIRPAATAMIAAAGLTVFSTSVLFFAKFKNDLSWQGFLSMFSWKTLLVFVLLFGASKVKKLEKLHPLVFIAAGAVLGIVLGL